MNGVFLFIARVPLKKTGFDEARLQFAILSCLPCGAERAFLIRLTEYDGLFSKTFDVCGCRVSSY